MLEQAVEKFEYIFDAWNKALKKDRNTPALSDSTGNHYTRVQADEISNRICAALKNRGIGRGDFVLINLKRGADAVLAVMGVWKSGAAFSLTENSGTDDRTDFIRRDCGARVEINDSSWNELLKAEPSADYAKADDHDVCFCVYTSGTTGTPKGVVHEYGQLKMEMLSEQIAPGKWTVYPGERWALIAPLNYVASIKTIVHFLYSGMHIYIPDYDTIKNPRKLNAYFLKNRINGTFLSPALIRMHGGNMGPFMKHVYTGAEAANNIYIKGVELLNVYSMSESMFTVARFTIKEQCAVAPIGNPLFDLPIKLIGENNEEVEEGELGELCFYNPYCRGYLNNDKENELHFINGWFHTGDLASHENGQYVLNGRRDDMVKINGNRIEPGEIEAVCRSVLNISKCAAKGFEKEGFVVLYYEGNITIDEPAVLKELGKKLPYYMIPSFFVKMDKLPMTNIGKLDRKKLSVPVEFLRAEYIAPRDEFEEKLANAFSEILGVSQIGIYDDFFHLGGSSLGVMELLTLMDDDLLTPTMIYKGKTVAEISLLHKTETESHLSREEKEQIGRNSRYPASDNILWFWNNANDASLDFYTAIAFSPVIPTGMIVKRLNYYISKNSTFRMVLKKGENGVPVQVYTPDAPYIKAERISKAKLESLKKSFVRRFGFNEPLIKMQVVTCRWRTYLFLHASHTVTDGAGFHMMLEDITNCLYGKQIEDSCYFAWAFEENARERSPHIRENLDYLNEKYFREDCDICIKADENTNRTGFGETRPAVLSLAEVKAYCERSGISVNNFIVAVTALAQCDYNQTDKNLICWNFNNRGPKDNHAGLMIRTCYFKIDRRELSTPEQLFASMKMQNEDVMQRLYEHEYFADFERAKNSPSMNVTYLEDWFSEDTQSLSVAKVVSIENRLKRNPESEKVFCLVCTHEDGNLCMTLNYGLSYLKEENAERFVALLEKASRELLYGRLL